MDGFVVGYALLAFIGFGDDVAEGFAQVGNGIVQVEAYFTALAGALFDGQLFRFCGLFFLRKNFALHIFFLNVSVSLHIVGLVCICLRCIFSLHVCRCIRCTLCHSFGHVGEHNLESIAANLVFAGVFHVLLCLHGQGDVLYTGKFHVGELQEGVVGSIAVHLLAIDRYNSFRETVYVFFDFHMDVVNGWVIVHIGERARRFSKAEIIFFADMLRQVRQVEDGFPVVRGFADSLLSGSQIFQDKLKIFHAQLHAAGALRLLVDYQSNVVHWRQNHFPAIAALTAARCIVICIHEIRKIASRLSTVDFGYDFTVFFGHFHFDGLYVRVVGHVGAAVADFVKLIGKGFAHVFRTEVQGECGPAVGSGGAAQFLWHRTGGKGCCNQLLLGQSRSLLNLLTFAGVLAFAASCRLLAFVASLTFITGLALITVLTFATGLTFLAGSPSQNCTFRTGCRSLLAFAAGLTFTAG